MPIAGSKRSRTTSEARPEGRKGQSLRIKKESESTLRSDVTSLPENAVQISSREQWRTWLTEHHERSAGVWLVTFKKAEGECHVPYSDMVEEALCFGWIDSTARSLDAARSMRWLTPRKPRSNWSAVNKAHIGRLVAAGQMHPAGLAKVEAAKVDGSWARLDEVDALRIPPDLAKAFDGNDGAAANFDAFPRSTKKVILEWILAAKRAETRAARVQETAELAARNERANQWPRKR
jgi:uncharacterized protein YdeI (YjbR/CyaY-like superfamily)